MISILHGNNIWGGGSGIFARREVLLSISFNSDLYSEDYDWWLKIFLYPYKNFEKEIFLPPLGNIFHELFHALNVFLLDNHPFLCELLKNYIFLLMKG